MITFSQLGVFGNGRLGNQMFQYAAAKSAALNANAVFAIPLENHELSKWFNLNCNYYSLQTSAINVSLLSKYVEGSFKYESRFKGIQDNTDMEGYFQSEKYFLAHSNIIRKEFNFKEEPLNAAKEFINSISTGLPNLVSVHVRRGDYIKLPRFHPVCSLAYYKEAFKYFEGCKIIIFSDDIEWCKQNMKDANIIFSSLKNHGEDLCAMSLCDHHIIANSSFGWWGAWLNANSDKIVFAPSAWFGEGYSDKDTGDLYCNRWKII